MAPKHRISSSSEDETATDQALPQASTSDGRAPPKKPKHTAGDEAIDDAMDEAGGNEDEILDEAGGKEVEIPDEGTGEEGEGEGPSKKQPKNKKTEDDRSAAVVARLQVIGKAWSDKNEVKTSNKELSGAARRTADDNLVDRIAAHLVREDKFIDAMQNPPQAELCLLLSRWIASLHLPGRYNRWDTANQFTSYLGTQDLYPRIFTRAMALYDEAVGLKQSTLHNTLLAPPQSTTHVLTIRKHLVAQHSMRQSIVNAIKAVIDLEDQIMRKLTTRLHNDIEQDSKAAVRYINELKVLEAAKEELRNKLRTSETVSRGRTALDVLLAKVPSSAIEPDLTRLPDSSANQPRVFTAHPMDTKSLDYDDIRAKLDQFGRDPSLDWHPAEAGHYYENERRGAVGLNDVMKIQAPRKWDDVPLTRPPPDMSSTHLDGTTWSERDAAVATEVERVLQSVNMNRFTVNLQYFEDLLSRPEEIATAKASDSGIFKNPAKRWMVVFDNIFHTRWFADQLRRQGLLKVTAKVKAIMRRLWGLLALMYGCVQEGGLLLELCDAMLEDLAELVEGNSDPRYNTETMQKWVKFRDTWSMDVINDVRFNEYDTEQLERNAKARGIFDEFVRCYHGSIVLGYADISWGARNGTNMEASKNWYDSLLRYCHDCPNTDCFEDLMLVDNRDVRNNRWGLSVAVKDSRRGMSENRPEWSLSNRTYIYPCLYELVHWTRWHEGYGVFFHYFAHLYHTSCQPTRGKDSLMRSIEISASRGDLS